MVTKVDLVVPYVDSSDPSWQSLFNEYNPDKKESKEEVNAINRFRGQGDFFKYWFRSIASNIPWINNIYLIVQSDSQVPRWLNRETVKIVYHEDIIPQEYLPTFNSTTIEMFVHNIPGLSEHFLYANDDIFIMKPLKIENFYTEDGKVKVSTRPMRDMYSLYPCHCLNGYCLVNGTEPDDFRRKNNFLPCFKHSIRPYIKSLVKECFKVHNKEILKGITPFRQECNHNMYLFDYYNIKKGQQTYGGCSGSCINSFCDNKYLDRFLKDNPVDMVAFQDTSDSINIYDNVVIRSYFITKYRTKSKYEL